MVGTCQQNGSERIKDDLGGCPDGYMFNIPAMENIAECIITKDTLTTKNPVLLRTQQTSEQLCLNNS